MLLPNAENAFIDMRKLESYCLNTSHPSGRHKAFLFHRVLGLGPGDAGRLRELLLHLIQVHEAKAGRFDEFGQRYVVDGPILMDDGSAILRSVWIAHAGEAPRLVTCYVL